MHVQIHVHAFGQIFCAYVFICQGLPGYKKDIVSNGIRNTLFRPENVLEFGKRTSSHGKFMPDFKVLAKSDSASN